MTMWYAITATLVAMAAWGYVLRYLYLTSGAWRRSLTGVALVTMGFANALTFSFISNNLWFTVLTGGANWPGRLIVGTTLFALLAMAVILVWIAFERAQKD
jgi:hypothetical protein